MTKHKPVSFKVATYNCSAKAVKRNKSGLRNDFKWLLNFADMVLLQECGEDVDFIQSTAKSFDFDTFYGNGPGAPSTPVLYRDDLDLVRSSSPLLTPRTDTNEPKAAGGEVIKAKYLNNVTVDFHGHTVTAGSVHTSPSIWAPRHAALNREQIRDAANFGSRLRGNVFIGGDWNRKAGDKGFKPLREEGFRSTQMRMGKVGTFNNKKGRPIDDIWYSPSDHDIVRPKRRMVRNGASDHLIYLVEFTII